MLQRLLEIIVLTKSAEVALIL